jgi:uncharacterized BrkB/YihY/UPF0761 family membrane protein
LPDRLECPQLAATWTLALSKIASGAFAPFKKRIPELRPGSAHEQNILSLMILPLLAPIGVLLVLVGPMPALLSALPHGILLMLTRLVLTATLRAALALTTLALILIHLITPPSRKTTREVNVPNQESLLAGRQK